MWDCYVVATAADEASGGGEALVEWSVEWPRAVAAFSAE